MLPGLAKIVEIRHLIPGLETVLCVDGAGAGASGFQEVMAAESGEFTPVDTARRRSRDDDLHLGTTGPPKGALHAHRVLPGHLPGFELCTSSSPGAMT